MTGLMTCKRPTAKNILVSAVALVATGFLIAAGYDIYSRLFKKTA